MSISQPSLNDLSLFDLFHPYFFFLPQKHLSIDLELTLESVDDLPLVSDFIHWSETLSRPVDEGWSVVVSLRVLSPITHKAQPHPRHPTVRTLDS